MEMQEPGKTRAIIAHITLIGWIIAIVQNSSDKNEDASFYIRQMLGLMILAVGLQIVSMIFAFIPFIGLLNRIHHNISCIMIMYCVDQKALLFVFLNNRLFP